MSSDALDPIANAQAWDKVSVGGTVSPGICTLSGFKRVFSWEVKEGKGVKGSTTTLNKYPPCEGTLTFQFWEPTHFAEWREFRKLFDYDTTKKTVSAVDIYHPSLADIGVKSVVCKSIGAIEPAGKGLFQCAVELLEYNPPPPAKKSAASTPSGSKGDSDNKTGDPIADAKQAEIARLLREAKGEDKPENEHIKQRGG